MLRLGHRAILGFALVMVCLPAVAHDMPTNTIMNAFVKIEPHQAHLVVRVPLDLLRGAPFPVLGGQYDTANSGPASEQALKALAQGFALLENDVRLQPSRSSGRLSLPSDRSFEEYDTALEHTSQGTETGVVIYYDQGSFDAHFIYPITSPKSVFKIQTWVAADIGSAAKLTVRFLPLNETSRALLIPGGSRPLVLNPAWYQAASGFVVLGVEHILSGIDHLLFLFCLVIPFRGIRRLIPVITAFTLAHSVTLMGSAYHLAPAGAWFPPFVETAIAASIVYMSLENILGANLRRRWLITGLFGLVHGFGFSYALGQQLQFAGSHLLVSLFSFNVGIEIGQLLVLAVMLPALALFRRVAPERAGVIVLSALAAHTAWHWMGERFDALRQAPWPRMDGPAVTTIARWAAAVLIAGGLASMLAKWAERRRPSRLKGFEAGLERVTTAGPERA
jgi:hypothetical protein